MTWPRTALHSSLILLSILSGSGYRVVSTARCDDEKNAVAIPWIGKVGVKVGLNPLLFTPCRSMGYFLRVRIFLPR